MIWQDLKQRLWRTGAGSHRPGGRKTHAYGIGAAKSGTHSVAGFLADRLRCAHEPESDALMGKLLDLHAGQVTVAQMNDYVLERDRRLGLELDSSSLNLCLLGNLLALFPAARFILTIRDPCSWVESFIHHQIVYPAPGVLKRYRDMRFKPDVHKHRKEEAVLRELNLYSLAGYLSHWNWHNLTAVTTAPAERLMIVRTDRLRLQAAAICDFLGISSANLDLSKTHEFKARQKHEILGKIDRGFVRDQVRQYCDRALLDMFPDIPV